MHKIITNPESRAAGIVRTIIALVVLFTFWGAIAYSFRAELTPTVVKESEPIVVPLIQDVDGERFESRYFIVRNASAASYEQVEASIEALEADYEVILAYQNLKPGQPIQVVIADGTLPALAYGSQLNLFYDQGVVHLDAAPIFLTLFSQGKTLSPDINLFIALGFALYLAEETQLAQGLGQSSDAWVEILRQQDALLPFNQAWEVNPPTTEDELYDFVRALVQGGSFIRWVADVYGPDTVQALLNGERLEDVTGLFFHEAEEDWLVALQAKGVTAVSCDSTEFDNHFVRAICQD
jgi:hypothetical protein